MIPLLIAALMFRGHAEAGSVKPYLGSATDFMEISQLFSRYNTAVDNGDGGAWASTFTPDGVFEDAQRCVVGHRALEALVGSKPMPGRDTERFHMQSLGPIVYTARNAASVRSTILVVEAARPEVAPRNWVTAVAVDTLKRVKGQWLIARRVVYKGSQAAAGACA
ncbi:nuclear transport factor 2 family protein [Novosphingobium sp.]|uniref:nuclear transport factor 2 family protein n=1 Tax=Novosphingobium sp. TaxID=1874826 RepID=UPI0028AB482C|nr:nuclear transport factor 2 family protein [Novosphingobium sp.]